jgi:UDP:flavonoid glycosyltransferase YjiC (YdhE family)
MPKVIIAGLPEFANMTPMLAVGRELLTRGHEVFFYTGSKFEDAARATGAGFRAFPPDVDFGEQELSRHLQERSTIPDGPARYAFDIKAGLIDPIPGLLRGLQVLLDEFPADVILSEHHFLPPLALALGRPSGQRPVLVTLGISPPLFHSEDTPPPGSAVSPMPGKEGRARHRAMNASVKQLLGAIQTSAEQTFASLGVKLDEFLWDAAFHHTDHYLQLTIPSLEYPRSDAPAYFRCIGPVPSDSRSHDDETPAWRPKLTAQQPIVAILLEQDADDQGDLLASVLRGLDDLEVLAVVATRHSRDPEAMSGKIELGNARRTAFAPLDQLLPSADIIITNADYDDVHPSLRHGVPVVAVDGGENEAEIAERIEWSGAGLNLRTASPKPIDIRMAVQTVLNNPRFRMRAKALSQEFTQYRAFDTIAEIVSAVQRRCP